MRKTALIAMSGGVDSSAAALILQQQGWDCTGITMQLHRENALCGTCARRVFLRRDTLSTCKIFR